MKRNTRISVHYYSACLLFGLLVGTAKAADIASITSKCDDCHGKDGASQESAIPIIGGMSDVYISDSLALYRDKTRPCEEVKYPAGEHKGESTDMCAIAEKLSEEESEQLGEHYAGKPYVRAKQDFDPELAKSGKGIHALHCKKCHEDGGTSPDDDSGFLGGQWMPYLEEQLEEYVSGKRVMPEKMKPKMEKLSAEDIKAVIQYYGSLQ